MAAVVYTAARDALGLTAELEPAELCPLLGVPLQVRSNSPTVLALADAAFGRWRELAASPSGRAVSALRLDVVVHPAARAAATGQPPVYRMHGGRFLAALGEDLLCADADVGEALAFVGPETVAESARFRREVLEGLALLLVSRRDRTPLHASAVVRAGRAVLLAGPSGEGKSTLAYACVRAGFELLAEEATYVSVATGRVRVWGNPWRLHLRPDARERFPELAGLEPQRLANGKLKLSVDPAALPGAGGVCLSAESAVLCLLQRRPGVASRLVPLAEAEARAAVCAGLEVGFDVHADAYERVAPMLAAGAWRLELGEDTAGAVELLARLAANRQKPGG